MSDEIAISQAAPRPRIHPTFLATLRENLGRRDWVKGERAQIHEILTHMRGQAASNGFPSKPVANDDNASARALKHAQLDGVADMLDERPDLFQRGELDVVPLLLFEASVHGLRQHAGHVRAVPSHMALIARERQGPAPELDVPEPRPSSLQAHARLDALDKRLDAHDAALAQILAAVTKPA